MLLMFAAVALLAVVLFLGAALWRVWLDGREGAGPGAFTPDTSRQK
jgi:hypothetical protein